ncbi:MAG: CYTH domain-containing protein [Erysipelotrichaceae bacterium]|nr:CYTH domain-containing protein [Erysipelotrichaceae bacterium]
MNEQIEIEYKILLTKDTYQQIINDYQNQITDAYLQVNDYFTHPLLNELHFMLRIRSKKDKYELTLKRPYQGHRLETNIDLTKEEKEKFINHEPMNNEIITILEENNIPYNQLQQLYSLSTYRTDILLDEGMLSLDKNNYLDKEDYELEFEVNDPIAGYSKFLEIIKPYHLQYIRNNTNKVIRAMTRYNELHNS